MNTLPNVYKLFHFSLTMSLLYLVKLIITQKQPTAYAVHSVELIVPYFCRKSFNVRLNSHTIISVHPCHEFLLARPAAEFLCKFCSSMGSDLGAGAIDLMK